METSQCWMIMSLAGHAEGLPGMTAFTAAASLFLWFPAARPGKNSNVLLLFMMSSCPGWSGALYKPHLLLLILPTPILNIHTGNTQKAISQRLSLHEVKPHSV